MEREEEGEFMVRNWSENTKRSSGKVSVLMLMMMMMMMIHAAARWKRNKGKRYTHIEKVALSSFIYY